VKRQQKAKIGCGGLRFPVIAGHDAAHEFIKQRYPERGIPMVGAPDHAFGDQLVIVLLAELQEFYKPAKIHQNEASRAADEGARVEGKMGGGWSWESVKRGA
jgi:hypothetical protein